VTKRIVVVEDRTCAGRCAMPEAAAPGIAKATAEQPDLTLLDIQTPVLGSPTIRAEPVRNARPGRVVADGLS
jgi:hypothetical protein